MTFLFICMAKLQKLLTPIIKEGILLSSCSLFKSKGHLTKIPKTQFGDNVSHMDDNGNLQWSGMSYTDQKAGNKSASKTPRYKEVAMPLKEYRDYQPKYTDKNQQVMDAVAFGISMVAKRVIASSKLKSGIKKVKTGCKIIRHKLKSKLAKRKGYTRLKDKRPGKASNSVTIDKDVEAFRAL